MGSAAFVLRDEEKRREGVGCDFDNLYTIERESTIFFFSCIKGDYYSLMITLMWSHIMFEPGREEQEQTLLRPQAEPCLGRRGRAGGLWPSKLSWIEETELTGLIIVEAANVIDA